MVLARLGPLAGELRGSLGTLTFSRNRFGALIRNRTIPVNPRTPLQVLIRTIFTSLVIAWRQTLTQVQRDGWTQYGDNVIMQNKLGESINLTGMNQFLRSNVGRVQAGLAVVEDAPTIFDLGETDILFSGVGSEATQLVSVVFDDTNSWLDIDGAAMLVYAGIPVDPTINFFNGPWRFMGSIEGDVALPPTTPQDLTSPYLIAEAQRQFYYGRITLADGRISEPFRNEKSVTA